MVETSEVGLEYQEKQGNPELKTPYAKVILPEAKRKIHPEEHKALDITFKEIDRQAVDNFEIFKSNLFPGVEFTAVKLEVKPDLINKLSELGTNDTQTVEDPNEIGSPAKNYKYFIQTAFVPPPNGTAYSAEDIGIDRFMRSIPRVARAVKNGEEPPSVEIYMLGAPTSLAGKVSKEWVDEVNKDGFEPYGILYGEYVESKVSKDPGELSKTRIILQGASKGTVTSDQTSQFLPENIRKQTQRIYDIPAGDHEKKLINKLAAVPNLGLGMGVEIALRIVADETTKGLGPAEKEFSNLLKEQKGIEEDTEEQKKLKGEALIAELKALMKGTPFDESERTFVRQPILDPVNIDPRAVYEVFYKDRLVNPIKNRLKNAGKEVTATLGGIPLEPEEKLPTSPPGLSAYQKGHVFHSPIKRFAHAYVFKRSFPRWEQNLFYARHSKPKR